jgi:hypothetical protein
VAELQGHKEKSEQLTKELDESKAATAAQSDQLADLKKQLEAVQPKAAEEAAAPEEATAPEAAEEKVEEPAAEAS